MFYYNAGNCDAGVKDNEEGKLKKIKRKEEEFCRIYIIEYSLNIKRRHSCTTQKN